MADKGGLSTASSAKETNNKQTEIVWQHLFGSYLDRKTTFPQLSSF
jgi:hypothetical protein